MMILVEYCRNTDSSSQKWGEGGEIPPFKKKKKIIFSKKNLARKWSQKWPTILYQKKIVSQSVYYVNLTRFCSWGPLNPWAAKNWYPWYRAYQTRQIIDGKTKDMENNGNKTWSLVSNSS